MKIAMVSEHASPLAVLGGVDSGGQNVHVAALARELARQGASVIVYTRREDDSTPKRVPFFDGVMVEHVDAGPPHQIAKDDIYPHLDDFAAYLHGAWRGWTPDVVHSHFWMSGKASLAAAASFGVPVVHTFHALGVVKRRHQGDRDPSPPARLDEERAILRRAAQIVATCSDEVFELKRLGADTDRITVVPCGVDTGLFRPRGRVEPRRAGMRRIVVLSRLVERKGIGDVIAALPLIPDAELVIAGGPPRASLWDDAEAVRLRSIAESAGVSNRVDFRGRVERTRVPELLRSADVVVTVPWYEPFGIVPLEAMACGVPVVASAVGGMVDTVVHGVTGLHVPPRQPRSVARAVEWLLDHEQARHRFGNQGVERAGERYTWERIARSTYETYRQVADMPLTAGSEVMPT